MKYDQEIHQIIVTHLGAFGFIVKDAEIEGLARKIDALIGERTGGLDVRVKRAENALAAGVMERAALQDAVVEACAGRTEWNGDLITGIRDLAKGYDLMRDRVNGWIERTHKAENAAMMTKAERDRVETLRYLCAASLAELQLDCIAATDAMGRDDLNLNERVRELGKMCGEALDRAARAEQWAAKQEARIAELLREAADTAYVNQNDAGELLARAQKAEEARDIAQKVIALANNSLFSAYEFFIDALPEGNPDPHHLSRAIDGLIRLAKVHESRVNELRREVASVTDKLHKAEEAWRHWHQKGLREGFFRGRDECSAWLTEQAEIAQGRAEEQEKIAESLERQATIIGNMAPPEDL